MTQENQEHVAASPFARAFFLTGATASGKTALGIAAAQEIGAEIVSLDSMAIYRGMDVGTAKPTVEERQGVPHHMFDVVDPEEEYSLVDYLKGAERAVADIESRGKKALFVGGTPLYLKGILFGVFDSPSANPELRAQLKAREEEAPGTLWRELSVVDHDAAQRLHPNDVKRLIRALEIYKLTGLPISSQQTQFDAAPLVDPGRVFILTRPREELYERINKRVRIMMEEGFLAEVRRLEERGVELGPTSSKAVGYKETSRILHKELSLEEGIERISQSTRNFAKRQETWFRSLCRDGARRLETSRKSFEKLRAELVEGIRRLEEPGA